jgi:hypothetical protein
MSRSSKRCGWLIRVSVPIAALAAYAAPVAGAQATGGGATAPTAATTPGVSTTPTAATATGADWRAKVRSFAAEHFKQPAWGYSHSSRDHALAHELAAADGVALDDDVLFAAAYLHDLAAFPPWADESKDHADIAADVVHTVLAGTGFPMQKVDVVRGAIRTHMYFRDPVGPEAVYLHDADALDWLGAIGVARIIALVDPQGGAPDGPEMVKTLEENLTNVPARVVSPAGRAQVPARRAELEKFLRDLRRESSDLRDL